MFTKDLPTLVCKMQSREKVTVRAIRAAISLECTNWRPSTDPSIDGKTLVDLLKYALLLRYKEVYRAYELAFGDLGNDGLYLRGLELYNLSQTLEGAVNTFGSYAGPFRELQHYLLDNFYQFDARQLRRA